MLAQLSLGSALILVSFLIAALAWWALEASLSKMHTWIIRPHHGAKLVVVLMIALIWTLLLMTVNVWLWALTLQGVGVFAALEPSVYFALVAFTTLGFGDVLLPVEWRLLGGLAAANGLLMFGLMTAILVETLRDTRRRQRGP